MTTSHEAHGIVVVTGASTGIGAATARELARLGLPAEAAAKVIAKAIGARTPRTRYTVGREAALLRLVRILPDRALDHILDAALRPHFPAANDLPTAAVSSAS
jgi:NAD(P)-dependent dehydrogenase (short-subunit alcohol dehydrogenase family)